MPRILSFMVTFGLAITTFAKSEKVLLDETGTVLGVKKSRVVFLVGQSGEVSIDEVKVVEKIP